MVRERTIEAYLVESVIALGGEVRKVKWLGRRNAPDRVVMLPKRLIWIELKATKKEARVGQLREHARLRAVGQQVEVVDSFERVDEVLNG